MEGQHVETVRCLEAAVQSDFQRPLLLVQCASEGTVVMYLLCPSQCCKFSGQSHLNELALPSWVLYLFIKRDKQ